MTAAKALIGVFGGSGIYQLEGSTVVEEITVPTPYGAASDSIRIVRLPGITEAVAFLPRHSSKHNLLPSEINYRANVFAMKSIGVKYILALSACGSLQEHIKPGDMVIVDQFIDRTQLRKSTFFGDGIVGHVGFAHPTCSHFRAVVAQAVRSVIDGAYNSASSGPLETNDSASSVTLHTSGVYINMEGPAFSTKAESHMYRAQGGTVIGMTTLTEAKLCREAEIAFCCLGLVTDYDCWREDEEPVDASSVIVIMRKNSAFAQKVTAKMIELIAANPFYSDAHDALKVAIVTSSDAVSLEQKQKLQPIFGRYLM